MIRAYPRCPTIVSGEPLLLHASTDAQRFRVRILRCGATFEEIPCTDRPHDGRFADAKDAGVPWDWPPYEIAVAHPGRSGAYIAVLEQDPFENPVREDRTGVTPDARSARALFVVRGTKPHARLLIVLPLFTYHAYNVADVDGTLGKSEGECLYSGARWVSLHRPGGGTGGHPWDEVNEDVYDSATPRQTFAHWDAKALAWLEREGYAYDCCTDLELHSGSIDLGAYRAIASFGHHEYWTYEMRGRVQAFVENGGNVAFFGGNTCWFRAEYHNERRAIRRAGRWRDVPEWQMTGVSYAFGGGKWIGARPLTAYRVTNASHWIFEGLGLRDGDYFGGPERLIGYECDGAPADGDLAILAHATIADWPVADGSGEVAQNGHAALGIRADNGAVFTASTVDWARVLYAGEKTVTGITRNVLNRFLMEKQRPGDEPNDEMDDAIINADDTGMVRAQHVIAEEGILEAENELEQTADE